MHYLSVDTECHLIKSGNICPRLVCVSAADTASEGHLLDREKGLGFVEACLKDDDITLIGQNVAFDFGVISSERPDLIPLIFDKYDKDLVHDTMIREQILDIAKGQLGGAFVGASKGKWDYTLAGIYFRRFGIELPKADTYRLRYAELDGIPIEQWPEAAVIYPKKDATATFEVYWDQEKKRNPQSSATSVDELVFEHGRNYPNWNPFEDLSRQCRAAFGLHLFSAWGIRTDGAAVAKLKKELETEREQILSRLRSTGIYKEGDVKNVKVIRERIRVAFEKLGRKPPKTEPTARNPEGQIQYGEEVLTESGDPDLMALGEIGPLDKVLGTYVPPMERAAVSPINPSYQVLMKTGRTSCREPNLQNVIKKGDIRSCFIPRPGFVFCAVDYDTAELRALAQVTKYKIYPGTVELKLLKALQDGEDPHILLAAVMMGISKEEAYKRYKEGDKAVIEYRQHSKIGNFGFPGGLGARAFVSYAKGFGLIIDEARSKEIRSFWLRAFPEMEYYFKYIAGVVGPMGEGTIMQLFSNRMRGGCSYTEAANGNFQSLIADGAKEAIWAVQKEAYTKPDSPLFGARASLFIHDEIIAEIPWHPSNPKPTSDAAFRQAEVMKVAMQKWLPDVPVACKPVLMRKWYKGAAGVKDAYGNLIPSKPVTRIGEDGKEKTDWVADIN